MKKITVIGAGFAGLTAGAGFTSGISVDIPKSDKDTVRPVLCPQKNLRCFVIADIYSSLGLPYFVDAFKTYVFALTLSWEASINTGTIIFSYNLTRN